MAKTIPPECHNVLNQTIDDITEVLVRIPETEHHRAMRAMVERALDMTRSFAELPTGYTTDEQEAHVADNIVAPVVRFGSGVIELTNQYLAAMRNREPLAHYPDQIIDAGKALRQTVYDAEVVQNHMLDAAK